MLGFYSRLPFKQYVHVAFAQQSLQNGWLTVERKKTPTVTGILICIVDLQSRIL